MTGMSLFQNLPEKQKLNLLGMLAETALGEFGFTNYRLSLIQNLVNTTYKMDCNKGAFLVRIHRKTELSRNCIDSELAWIEALSKESQVPVQQPQYSLKNDRIVTVQVPTYDEHFHVTVLSWVDGMILPQDKRTDVHFRQLGLILAKLHQHSRLWTPPTYFKRPRLDVNSITTHPGWRNLEAPVRDDLETARQLVAETESSLKQSPAAFGLIHSDLSFGNVLFNQTSAIPIDFEDCGFGYYLYDIAVVLAGTCGRKDFLPRRDALWDEYCKTCPLDETHIEKLPIFMGARALSMVLWAASQLEVNDVKSQWQKLRDVLRLA
jgi:Ser/Thr protein kinase RdoA (MazF antagonist)